MFAPYGSEIDLSQDGSKGSGAQMPIVFKNNARGLCDAGGLNWNGWRAPDGVERGRLQRPRRERQKR